MISSSIGDKRNLLAQLLQQRAAKRLSYWPTTSGQQALWVLNATYPTSPAYNIAFCARLEGKLRKDALRAALQALVQRHPLLRARFLFHEGSLKQEIAGFRPLPWEEVDCAAKSGGDFVQRLRLDYARPFQLDRDIPIRTTLYRLGAEEHVLLISFHHIVFDAWSLWLCVDELFRLYLAEAESRESPLPPIAAQYDDYIVEQERLLVGPEGKRLLRFWREKLDGLQYPAAIPASLQRRGRLEPRGASVHFRIDAELAEAARTLAARLGVTPFSLYLTVLFTLLHRYVGQDDLSIGCPTNGRGQHRFLEVVGYFVNPVVIRADLSGDPSFEELVQRLRSTITESLDHQNYPFSKLVEQLDLAREPGRTPLFQLLFNYYKPQGLSQSLESAMNGEGWQLGDLRAHYQHLDQQEGQFELAVDLLDLGAELQATIKYHTYLYDQGAATRLCSHFLTLLRGIVTEPSRKLSQLPVLSADEARRILQEWNDTTAPRPMELCAHDLFIAQARRTPDAIALIHGETHLTYSELRRSRLIFPELRLIRLRYFWIIGSRCRSGRSGSATCLRSRSLA